MFRLDVRSSAELQDLIRALKASQRDVAQQIRAQSKAVAQKAWQEELNGNVSTTYENRLAGTGRAVVSDQNVTLQAAKVRGKKFSGGLDLRESWNVVERGANYAKKTTYSRRSSKGKTHQVTRRTMTGFRPRTRGGYVLGPAQQETAPRIIALWVQTAMRVLFDNLDRKG